MTHDALPSSNHAADVAASKRRLPMGILLFIVFGLVVGLVARAIMPGRQSMSMVMTALLGIGGSFVGGFLGALITNSRVTDFNTAGILGSILGAIVVLIAAGAVMGRTALAR
jgi:uncharacterized membrane protein YeaQ/YmgE (transglycosylase-associated protein family)